MELLLIDTIEENLIKKMDKKTVMRFLPHHSFILVKFNFYKFTFTYLNDHALFKGKVFFCIFFTIYFESTGFNRATCFTIRGSQTSICTELWHKDWFCWRIHSVFRNICRQRALLEYALEFFFCFESSFFTMVQTNDGTS